MTVPSSRSRFRKGSYLLAGLLLAAALPVRAATVSLWNPSPTAFDRGGGTGRDVVAPITVSPADGVVSLDLSFSYDPAVVTPRSVHRTGLTRDFTVVPDLSTPGQVHLSMSGATPLAGSGEVAWVLFRVTGPAGSASPLTWIDATLNGGSVPATLQDGRIPVVTGASVLGVPDGAEGAPGALVDVAVGASPADGAEGIDLRVESNPDVVVALSVQPTPLTAGMSLTSNLSQPGRVLISLFGTEPLQGSGPLAVITYQVVGPLGDETPLNLSRGEINEGAISTVLDDGLLRVCTTVDGDGDGVTGCAGDCDDGDGAVYPGAPETCNGVDDDCDGAADEGVVAPAGIPSMSAQKSGSDATFSWAAVPGATGYDTVRGDLAVLRAGGDLGTAATSCLANDRAATTITDADLPPAGQAAWHLVRPVNCGGPGTYDDGSATQQPGRDLEIERSEAACP